MNKKEVLKKQVIRCKRCNSTQTYVRISKKDRVCRACGYCENLEVNNG